MFTNHARVSNGSSCLQIQKVIHCLCETAGFNWFREIHLEAGPECAAPGRITREGRECERRHVPIA